MKEEIILAFDLGTYTYTEVGSIYFIQHSVSRKSLTMVLSGNSTQANGSRTNSVVALSGKEQISPVLLLSDNAPENHSEMEQSCMANVIRTSLRNRKKPSLGDVGVKQCDRSSNVFVGEKTFADVKGFVNGNQLSSPMRHDTSKYLSLVDFLSNTPSDSLPLDKNGISSLWTCGQCCQTFLSNTELEVHLASHKAKSIPPLSNNVKSVIASNKKRQSPDEPTATKRLKRSASPDQYFIFNAATMQQIASNGEKFYKCDICEQLYATSDLTGFKIHYLRSHINYQFISSADRVLCSIVDDGLKSKVTDFLYRCYFCNISCADKQVLIEHNSEHKSNVFRCEHCHAVFYQNKAFTNHVKNCTKAPRNTETTTLCLFCKEPTTFLTEDRDIHTREYHCYSNGVIKMVCNYGCATKFKKLCYLYKHYASVHRDTYFSCVLCKVRFLTVNQLWAHNKYKHNIDFPSNDKKLPLSVGAKSDRVNLVPKKSKAVKPSVVPCDVTQVLKAPSQPMVKPSNQAVVKSNGQAVVKSNGTTSASPSPPPPRALSSEQQHFQDILFKSILKIDLVEQINVLKKHAAQYPAMLSLPKHPLFTSSAEDPECPYCPVPGDEDFLHPVFSSSEENNVYICKACGFQNDNLSELSMHMTSAHPYIHNDYYAFNREDLPQDFWTLSHPQDLKTKPSSVGRSSNKLKNQYKCSCCAFECKESAEFHKHLLQCAKKHKQPKTEIQTKSKASTDKKEEVSGENSRRRMVITGVLREVPDDPLFSYKKELEKTMRKPGDSETVFNMLNKLPSKRLVKTTERYDSLFYKNNKAMKPKRSSMERLALNDRDLCYSLDDYLKYFIKHEPQEDKSIETKDTNSISCDKSSNELNKQVVDKKVKVVKTNSNEELNKVPGEKKCKVVKDTSKIVGDKKVKSPKLNGIEETTNRQISDSKKCKVSKSNHLDEKKMKPNGALSDVVKKLNGSNNKSLIKEFSNKGDGERKRKVMEIGNTGVEESEIMKQLPDDMACKSLQNVKVVQIHYPTLISKSPSSAHVKSKTLKTSDKHSTKSNKNILVEKKLKNLNAAVKKKGKPIHQDVKKKIIVNKNNKSKNLNHLVKIPNKTTKANCDKTNTEVIQRDKLPRKKKTTRIVIVSDQPLLPLPTMKKDKKK